MIQSITNSLPYRYFRCFDGIPVADDTRTKLWHASECLLKTKKKNFTTKMADSPTEEVAGNTSEPNCNDKAENEVDESLDDFLRDTNDLLTNSNEGNSNSPDSSGDGEGEKRKNI